MLEQGWQTRKLAFDVDSSLVPAATATAEEDEMEGLSAEEAAVMRANLQEAGFTLRKVHSKASWRQSSVESSIRLVKRILKASFLPLPGGMTVISFVRTV